MTITTKPASGADTLRFTLSLIVWSENEGKHVATADISRDDILTIMENADEKQVGAGVYLLGVVTDALGTSPRAIEKIRKNFYRHRAKVKP
jgi:hypothetical protein